MTSNIKIGESRAPTEVAFAATTENYVYLCIGGTHTLTPTGLADSPWVGQGVSLNASLGEALPISAIPGLGQLQPFAPDGCSWEIKFPDDGAPIESSLQLHSEYTAQPYIIPVRLGHYRLEFGDLDKPIGAPVIGEEVIAGIQVVSYYTKQGVEGVDVRWFVDGDPAGSVITTESGRSEFKHTFVEAGSHTIEAEVYSAYNDELTTHTFSLKVYEHSPWQDATLTINGEIVSWRSPVVLVHGEPNEVIVEVSPDIAAQLKFDLVEVQGPVIDVTPPEGSWQDPVNGQFKWVLTPEQGKSGRVKVVFYSQQVELPWEHPAWVVSRDFSDDVDVVIDNDPVDIDGNIFIRNRPRTIKLVLKAGSPIQGLPVALARVIKSGLQEDDLVSLPVFDLPTSALSWDVTGKTNSGTFELIFSHAGVAPPLKLALNILLSDKLNDEGKVQIGGEDIPTGGKVFFRGQQPTLTFVPNPQSPIALLLLSLQWVKGTGLDKSDFECKPDFDEEVELHSWQITTPTSKSGTFDLQLVCKQIDGPILLSDCLLVSSNFADEADILLGGTVISSGLVFYKAEKQELTVVPKAGSPVGRLKMSLQWDTGKGLLPADFTFDPNLDLQTTDHKWGITGPADKSGTFQLKLACEPFGAPIVMPVILLISRDLSEEATVKIAGVDVPANGTIFFRGEALALTLEPSPGSPIADFPWRLEWVNGKGLSKTDLICKPEFDSDNTSHQWEVEGPADKSGYFQVQLVLTTFGLKIPLPECPLLSRNLQDEMSSITLDDGAGTPVDLYEEGMVLTSDLARITFKPNAGSPVKGREVSFKWVAGSNSSIVISPESIVFGESGIVEFRGVEHPDSNKTHRLCLDYGGAETDPWDFKYINSTNDSPKVLFEGLEHGETPAYLEFNKWYEVAVVPRTDDSVLIGWKCSFSTPSTSGYSVQLSPVAGEWINIEAPSQGGGKVNVRVVKVGVITNPQFDLGMLVKNMSLRNLPMRVLDVVAND